MRANSIMLLGKMASDILWVLGSSSLIELLTKIIWNGE